MPITIGEMISGGQKKRGERERETSMPMHHSTHPNEKEKPSDSLSLKIRSIVSSHVVHFSLA